MDISKKDTALRKLLYETEGYLNNICFGENIFCRYWKDGNPMDRFNDARPCYSFYDLSGDRVRGDGKNQPGFAFGYFISNLLETIYRRIGYRPLTNQYYEFLYPITNGKETYRLEECDIKQGSALPQGHDKY
ncbi:hypothetical protein P0G10_18585 [Eubacteriales bacterium DFI.9.88]|nr:hypothetical protein [Eubacteriales bacterium DFI.9.88]